MKTVNTAKSIENAGYFIVEMETYKICEDNKEREYKIVLGYNPKAKYAKYVTWDCVKNKTEYSFFWGHYFDNETDAYKDYHERLSIMYTTPF